MQAKWQDSIRLNETPDDEYAGIQAGGEFGSGKSRDKEEALLADIISRMNERFAAEKLSEAGLVNYANIIADKVRENDAIMTQVRNHTSQQTLLGDFPNAVVDAVLASSDANNEIKTQFLSDLAVKRGFERLILDLLAKAG